MARRTLITLSLVLAAAAPLAAQMKNDPDKKVAGGGLPAGWMGRTDDAGAKINDAKFAIMGTGYHVTSGPAAIYWTEKTHAKGPFTAAVTRLTGSSPSSRRST